MGSRYKATCKACHHQFELIKGGGWTWYQKVCNTCGSCMKVPRNGPSWFNGDEMSEEDMVKHLTTPDGWSRNGGKFDDAENQMLEKITTLCECGGEMIPEWDSRANYRCPECKVYDLELKEEILFD